MRGLLLAAGLLSLLGVRPTLAAPGPFANWAAVVISGDDEAAHVDAHTEAFDNARRDIGRALERRGFAAANIGEYSVEPDRHPDTRPGPAELDAVSSGLRRETRRAGAGCLVYLTSHGSPDGAVLGDRILPPRALARMIGASCGARPTVVVVSACFSGVFVPALAGPNRLVLTAARRDRSSFGCGEADTYPFFDGCVLESLPTARDFLTLAARTKTCVARRELEEKVAPPSEPQISVGARFHAPPFPPPG
jgi:hypothetical protein